MDLIEIRVLFYVTLAKVLDKYSGIKVEVGDGIKTFRNKECVSS